MGLIELMDPTAVDVMDALEAPPTVAEALPTGPGSLAAATLIVQGRPVVVVRFDYHAQQGSIGPQEADQLVRTLRTARSNQWPIVLLMETSGIRVTDGTVGIASLRRVLREAEDARLDGTRMLAVVLRCAFGGASILAALCERRLIHAGSLFGMSGPKLITRSVGADRFDASDAAAVEALLGGTARAAASAGFQLVSPERHALADAVREWLRSPAPPSVTAHALTCAGEALTRRLGEMAASTRPCGGMLALSAPEGAGAREALAVATALLHAEPPRRTTVVVDTPGHRSTPDEERLVLSEYLAHLALTVRALARAGDRIDIVVDGVGGGGIQGALGSGATSVAMAPDARLLVLPPAAMQALEKPQRDDEGGLEEALQTGAVDAASTLGSPGRA